MCFFFIYCLDKIITEGQGDSSSNGVQLAPSTTMTLEEKRQAIKAERLRKQQEMEALMAEEEALLQAAEQG